MNYAIVDSGTVTNIAEASPEFAASQGWIDATGAAIGDTWDGSKFVPKVVVIIITIPQSVKMRQARLALHQAGKLETVEQNIQLLDKPAQIEWEFAETVERSSPLVTKLSELLNMSTAEVDQLFISASTL
jgi:hypothetical protein